MSEFCYLSAEIGQGFYKVQVIGDLPKDEAQEFFQASVLPSFGLPPQLSNEEWTSIYEVRGDLILSSEKLLHACISFCLFLSYNSGAGGGRKPRAADQRCQRVQRRLAAK